MTTAEPSERTGRQPRRRRLVVGSLLVIAAGVAGALWLGRPERIEVEATAVERGQVEETVTNSRAGTVVARRRAELSPDSGGRVAALPVREGERVAAGVVVLELDAALERGEVALRERARAAAAAERERACLAAARAARELGRSRELAREEILAADQLDRQTSAAQEADASCTAARAQEASAAAAVALAREALAKRTLRAPFAGVVAELATEVGEWITPSPPGVPIPPVLDLLDPTSIYVSLPMDEVDAGRLRPGLPARVTVDSLPGEELPALVVRVAPYVLDIQAQNRTVEIEVELDDPALAATLLPGTSADVEVVLDRREDALRVPAGAVLAGGEVLVVGEDDRLAARRVELGLRNWDYVEVRSGLAAGERVVTSLDRPEVAAGALVTVRAAGEGAAGEP